MFIDFRERGAGAEREKLQSVASCTCPTGDQTRNLGIALIGKQTCSNQLSHPARTHSLEFKPLGAFSLTQPHGQIIHID